MLVLLPSFSSRLLAKCQGPFVVKHGVADTDYDKGGATLVYHLNLLKVWREAGTVSLMSLVRERDELRCQIQPFPPSSIMMTISQRSREQMLLALQHQLYLRNCQYSGITSIYIYIYDGLQTRRNLLGPKIDMDTHLLLSVSIHSWNHVMTRFWHSSNPVLQARLIAFTWLYLQDRQIENRSIDKNF